MTTALQYPQNFVTYFYKLHQKKTIKNDYFTEKALFVLQYFPLPAYHLPENDKLTGEAN